MWKNIVEPERPQVATWRITCCIPKSKNTHSEYEIPIAFPQQKWLHEHTSMLRCSILPVLFFSWCTMYYYTVYPNTEITYNDLSEKFAQNERINESIEVK
jgi:hypothetical protein